MFRRSGAFPQASRCVRPAIGLSCSWASTALSETAPFRWIISLDAPVEYRRELFEGDLPGPGGADRPGTPGSDGAGGVRSWRDAWHGDDEGEGAGGFGTCRV